MSEGLTRRQAREILDAALANRGKSPASTFTVRNGPDLDRRSLSWWRANVKADEPSETARSIGYLEGYIRIAGDGLLFASGLPLTDGEYLVMDRSVIKRFERDGYLRWTALNAEPHFEIAPRCALLLMPTS